MVRYGAELVFSSEAGNITDADIEAIIKKGEKDTAALNSKMQQFTDSAKQFTMDGGITVYDFKEEDEEKEGDLNTLKAIMAHNWVEPSKRERKRVLNYSESEYYKQVSVAFGPGSRRGWRQGFLGCR